MQDHIVIINFIIIIQFFHITYIKIIDYLQTFER